MPDAPTIKPIPGFTVHGRRYLARVTIERRDAEDVAEEAAERGEPVSAVLRDRIRDSVKRRRRDRS